VDRTLDPDPAIAPQARGTASFPGWGKVLLCATAAVLLCGAAGDGPSETALAAQREAMVQTIARMTAGARAKDVRQIDRAVLDAMRAVPRHRLVPPEEAAHAYENRPLPIGHEQTISQPFIVALMTHVLAPRADHVVLEVGTGSGYQAAVLSRLVRQVYTIEIVPQLARQAADRLSDLGYRNITVRQGDGYAGWPEHAPFDGIIVTAGAERIPEPLLAQLKRGGRMVIPLGPSTDQQLVLVTKSSEGRISREVLLPVRFVPFTREAQ
jgi:protein-L-isoaspartate(D-aspartate) O-methyltransferase